MKWYFWKYKFPFLFFIFYILFCSLSPNNFLADKMSLLLSLVTYRQSKITTPKSSVFVAKGWENTGHSHCIKKHSFSASRALLCTHFLWNTLCSILPWKFPNAFKEITLMVRYLVTFDAIQICRYCYVWQNELFELRLIKIHQDHRS